MKTTITRILTATLAATLVLLCLLSFAACGKQDSVGIDAPTPMPNDAKDKAAAAKAYVLENQAILEEVVAFVTKRDGLSYYYFVRDNQKKIYVQELVNKRGNLVRENVTDDLLVRLAATGFVGEMTHNKETTKGVVSFYTYMSDNKATHMIAYCPDETALNFLYSGFFYGADNVSTTPIVGNWYYVETT